MVRRPVHEVGRVLVRATEDDLLALVEVDDLLLDAWGLAWQKEVEHAVHVLLERDTWRGADLGQDDALRASFRYVL